MRLKTFVSPSVASALERVSDELGPNALILETAQEGEMTRIVAADVEREEPVEGLMRLRAELALLRREIAQQSETLRSLMAERMSRRAESPAAHAAEAASLAAEIAAGGGRDAKSLAPRPAVATQVAPLVLPRLAPIERRLREQGLRDDLLRRVLALCAGAPKREGDPLLPTRTEFGLAAVAGLLPGLPPAGDRRVRAFVFTGPPRAGKTSTLLKLAARAKPSERAQMAIVSLDDRPAANEALRRAAEKGGVAFATARGAEDLIRRFDELGAPRTLLVDAGGASARERNAVTALRERLHLPGQVAVHLVLPLDAGAAANIAAGRPLLALEPSSLVLTRVDLADRLGDLFNLPIALELPIAAIAHGDQAAADLVPATRRLAAELLLGRKLVPRRAS
jgi:flagellar biosynthesis GTPase FlhF